MSQTPQATIEAIEEVFDNYGAKTIQRLINTRDLTTEEVHALRGKALAAKELLGSLRSTLGYTVE